MNKLSLLKRIIYRIQINKYLNEYVFTKNAKMNEFEVLDNEKSIKLQDLINELNKYKDFYNQELTKIENIDKAINVHNKEISVIKSYDFGDKIKTFYENPMQYKESDFAGDLEISKNIEKYKNVDKTIKENAKEIIKISKNFSVINEQFVLYNEYNDLIDLKDIYFDSKRSSDLKERLNFIEKSLKGREQFYKFPLLNKDKLDDYIGNHNSNYVEKHLNDRVYDNVNGKSLDLEQRQAVLKDETCSLTIAGAGSGKTLTICGKIKYLLQNNINPEEILLLSYSKKSAEDLEVKTKDINPNLTVGTFHKIGLEILEEEQNKKFVIEDQFNSIIESYFRDELKKDTKATREILYYYGLYINSKGYEDKYEDVGQSYEDLKSSDFKTLRETLSNISGERNRKITIKKEIVKSIEELEIANFYFLNGIEYVYEKPYEHDVSDKDHRQYTPDFYLKDYNLYHEHYGLDKNGNASQYKGPEAQKYIEGVEWKKNIHKNNSTICLETYSYEFSDGTIYEKLTEQLKNYGVKFNPLNNEQIYDALNSIYQDKSFKSFITVIKSFISLYKAKYIDNCMFNELKKTVFIDTYQRNRASLFLGICEKIYLYYIDYIKREDKIDFDDMILKSKEGVNCLDDFKYKYIIVDEFQDISYSRMQFLKALIEHGESKLFAVGDDWQAIYRFSGCDLSIFTKFKNYFGKSEINYITSTHRNSQELQDIAGPFIRKNPQQLNKTIKSNKHLENPIKIVYFNDKKYDAFQQTLFLINQRNSNANILILGRNNKDLDDILSDRLYEKKSFDNDSNLKLYSKDYPDLNLSFSTVHGSKGLEEDFVIIINADDNKLGFPNKMEDDPILNLVLSEDDQMEFAEERRLWYVALTRTRSYCYILVNAQSPSMFINEIKDKCEVINKESLPKINSPAKCPYCKSGRLILKNNQAGEKFYGCSNYPYCNYTIDVNNINHEMYVCPKCGDFMIKRKGRYGYFYGCHSYPYCDYKMPIKNC